MSTQGLSQTGECSMSIAEAYTEVLQNTWRSLTKHYDAF